MAGIRECLDNAGEKKSILKEETDRAKEAETAAAASFTAGEATLAALIAAKEYPTEDEARRVLAEAREQKERKNRSCQIAAEEGGEGSRGDIDPKIHPGAAGT